MYLVTEDWYNIPVEIPRVSYKIHFTKNVKLSYLNKASRVFLFGAILIQIRHKVRIFVLYGTWSFSPVFTSECHMSVFRGTLIQSTIFKHFYVRTILLACFSYLKKWKETYDVTLLTLLSVYTSKLLRVETVGPEEKAVTVPYKHHVACDMAPDSTNKAVREAPRIQP
jgi:hypothetical protein